MRALPILVLFAAACSPGAGPANGARPASDGGAASESAGCAGTTLTLSPSVAVTSVSTVLFGALHPALAATPQGDAFLVTWWPTPSPAAVWASVVATGGPAPVASSPVQFTGSSSCAPVAAWGPGGFAVAWADGSDLMLRALDTGGALTGTPSTVASRPGAAPCPSGLVSGSQGLVLEWTEGQSNDSKAYAALLDTSYAAGTPILLPGNGVGAALASVRGVPYATYIEVAEASTSSVWVSPVNAATPPATSVAQGNLVDCFSGYAFFAAQTRLAALVSESDSASITLYEGVPGGVFQAVTPIDSDVFNATSDGCGRIVGLKTNGQTAGSGGAVGPTWRRSCRGPPHRRCSSPVDTARRGWPGRMRQWESPGSIRRRGPTRCASRSLAGASPERGERSPLALRVRSLYIVHMKRFSAATARQQLSHLLDAVERGEGVVIERRGVQFEVVSRKASRRRTPPPSLIEWVDPAVNEGQWTWEAKKGAVAFAPRRVKR